MPLWCNKPIYPYDISTHLQLLDVRDCKSWNYPFERKFSQTPQKSSITQLCFRVIVFFFTLRIEIELCNMLIAFHFQLFVWTDDDRVRSTFDYVINKSASPKVYMTIAYPNPSIVFVNWVEIFKFRPCGVNLHAFFKFVCHLYKVCRQPRVCIDLPYSRRGHFSSAQNLRVLQTANSKWNFFIIVV